MTEEQEKLMRTAETLRNGLTAMQRNDRRNARTRKTLFTEAVLITAATGFLYLAAYSYEKGFAEVMQFPVGIISVSIEAIIRCLVPIVLLLPAITFAVAYCVGVLHAINQPNVFKRLLALNLAGVGAVALILKHLDAERTAFITLLLITLGFNAAYLAIHFISQRIPAEMEERAMARLVENRGFHIFDAVHSNPFYLVIICLTGTFSLLAEQLGKRDARREKTFDYLPSKNLVLVRTYGDKFIAKVKGSEPNTLEKQTVILTTEQLAGIPMERIIFESAPKLVEKKEAPPITPPSHP